MSGRQRLWEGRWREREAKPSFWYESDKNFATKESSYPFCERRERKAGRQGDARKKNNSRKERAITAGKIEKDGEAQGREGKMDSGGRAEALQEGV